MEPISRKLELLYNEWLDRSADIALEFRKENKPDWERGWLQGLATAYLNAAEKVRRLMDQLEREEQK